MNKNKKKQQFKNQDKFEKQLRNDWSFYALDENMAKDAANIPYNVVPGTPVSLFSSDVPCNYTHSRFLPYFPGVMSINYYPVPGSSYDATSGINMAARQIYSFIRRNNSGARNYEAPDMMLYILAMEQVYSMYFNARRALCLAQTFYYMNRFTPGVITQAAGFDDQDIYGRTAEYRAKLNVLREKINSMAVPQGLKSFERRVVVNSQVFMDSTSRRSGYYVFRPIAYWKYNPTKYETGGCLEFNYLNTNMMVLDDYLKRIDECITTILTDDDMNTMSGDILKAYGENGIYTVTNVDENSRCEPVYDENILGQIENSKTWNVASYNSDLDDTGFTGFQNLDVFQKDNTLYFRPGVTLTYSPEDSARNKVIRNWLNTKMKTLFNSHKDSPDYKDNLEWSRLTAVYAPQLGSSRALCFGLEIVISYGLYSAKPYDSSSEHVEYTYFEMSSILLTLGPNHSDEAVVMLAAVSQFDWHPAIYCVNIVGNITSEAPYVKEYKISPPAMDLKVYTVVDQETIANMHRLANYSVYYLKSK